jgi:hypothetical protein
MLRARLRWCANCASGSLASRWSTLHQVWLHSDRSRTVPCSLTKCWVVDELTQAAYFGSEGGARLLVGAGARIGLTSRDGQTPAAVARTRGFPVLAGRLDAAMMSSLWALETHREPGLLPASCQWGEAVKKTNDRPHAIRVGYGGGVVDIPSGSQYWVDSWGRVLVGWHGTFDPPAGMDGESLVTVQTDT